MLNAVGQAVIATDLDQCIVFWNTTATGMFGWTEEKDLGQKIDEILPPHGNSAMLSEIKANLTQGEIWSGEIVVQCRDKRMLPLFTTNSPLLDDRGHLIAIIGIGTDISKRKQDEEIIRKHIKELTQFNRVAVQRELRMIELKQEVNALCAEAGQPPRYALQFLEENDASTGQ